MQMHEKTLKKIPAARRDAEVGDRPWDGAHCRLQSTLANLGV
jgi:hypothetical protein